LGGKKKKNSTKDKGKKLEREGAQNENLGLGAVTAQREVGEENKNTGQGNGRRGELRRGG